MLYSELTKLLGMSESNDMEVALKVGVSLMTIYRWRTGKNKISKQTAELITLKFGAKELTNGPVIQERKKAEPKAPKLEKVHHPKVADYEPEDMSLAFEWADWTHQTLPHKPINTDTYAKSIRITREYLKYDHKQMEELFEWIKNDGFWSTVCKSPCGLMKIKDKTHRKIDNLITKKNASQYSSAGDDIRKYKQATGEPLSTKEEWGM
jgi:transcriptional regulator with XRE-family HTH domain